MARSVAGLPVIAEEWTASTALWVGLQPEAPRKIAEAIPRSNPVARLVTRGSSRWRAADPSPSDRRPLYLHSSGPSIAGRWSRSPPRGFGNLFSERFSNRQCLLRAGAQGPATQHQPRGHAVGRSRREAPRGVAVARPARRIQLTSGTPRPCGSSPVAIVTSRDTARATTPSAPAEWRQGQQFPRRARPGRSPGPGAGCPPVAILPSNSRARPDIGESARGRPNRLSSTRSAAASICSRASACSGARCHTPTKAVSPPSSACATRSAPANTGSLIARACPVASSSFQPAVEHRRRPSRPRSEASAAVTSQRRRLARWRCRAARAHPGPGHFSGGDAGRRSIQRSQRGSEVTSCPRSGLGFSRRAAAPSFACPCDLPRVSRGAPPGDRQPAVAGPCSPRRGCVNTSSSWRVFFPPRPACITSTSSAICRMTAEVSTTNEIAQANCASFSPAKQLVEYLRQHLHPRRRARRQLRRRPAPPAATPAPARSATRWRWRTDNSRGAAVQHRQRKRHLLDQLSHSRAPACGGYRCR